MESDNNDNQPRHQNILLYAPPPSKEEFAAQFRALFIHFLCMKI